MLVRWKICSLPTVHTHPATQSIGWNSAGNYYYSPSKPTGSWKKGSFSLQGSSTLNYYCLVAVVTLGNKSKERMCPSLMVSTCYNYLLNTANRELGEQLSTLRQPPFKSLQSLIIRPNHILKLIKSFARSKISHLL